MAKALKILIVLLIILAAGVGVYWFFDRQQGGDGSILNKDFSLGDFFPFGQDNPSDTGATRQTNPSGPDTGGNTEGPVAPPRLWQISKDPQAGAVVFNASNTPTVRFVDRANGNVFESSLWLVGTKRISNTTVPKVYEAAWQPDGRSVVLRYLINDNKTIRSAYSRLVSTGTTTSSGGGGLFELQGTLLSDNLKSLVINPETGALAFITDNQTGSVVTIADKNAANQKQIFTSPIRDWNIDWINGTTLDLTTKPSADAPGFVYHLKTSGGLSRIMGDMNGLVSLSNSPETKVLYTSVKNNSVQSGLLNPKTGEILTIPLKLIADKCVWSKQNVYIYCAVPKSIPPQKFPDYWYQGRTSFSDSIWKIDTSNLSTDLLIDPSASVGKEIDAINLMLDPNEQYLLFTNKKDSQLWGLKIVASS